MAGVSSISTDRFIASEELGRFKVMNWNGTVDYTFDPTTLAAANLDGRLGYTVQVE